MKIKLNERESEVTESANLLQILTQEGLSDRKGIAVAVNMTVVARHDWSTFILNENDNILIIRATQGG